MNLPTPLQAYFDADNRRDLETLLEAFTPDAVFTDEGRSYAGREAIEGWWREAKAKYGHHAQPLEASEVDGAIKVRARVSGKFPGSPAEITFAFQIKDGLIAELEIGA